jgi:hypothetical protein
MDETALKKYVLQITEHSSRQDRHKCMLPTAKLRTHMCVQACVRTRSVSGRAGHAMLL